MLRRIQEEREAFDASLRPPPPPIFPSSFPHLSLPRSLHHSAQAQETRGQITDTEEDDEEDEEEGEGGRRKSERGDGGGNGREPSSDPAIANAAAATVANVDVEGEEARRREEGETRTGTGTETRMETEETRAGEGRQGGEEGEGGGEDQVGEEGEGGDDVNENDNDNENNELVVGVPDDIQLAEFKSQVRMYLEMDNAIKRLQVMLKDRRAYKQQLADRMIKFMTRYNIEDLDTPDGKIRSQVTHAKAPLPQWQIRDNIAAFFTRRNAPDLGMQLTDTLFNNRERVERVRLRRNTANPGVANRGGGRRG